MPGMRGKFLMRAAGHSEKSTKGLPFAFMPAISSAMQNRCGSLCWTFRKELRPSVAFHARVCPPPSTQRTLPRRNNAFHLTIAFAKFVITSEPLSTRPPHEAIKAQYS